VFVLSKDFSWEIKSPLSTNQRKNIGIFKFFALLSNIWKIGEMKRADKIEDRTDPWPTPTSALREGNIKLFHK